MYYKLALSLVDVRYPTHPLTLIYISSVKLNINGRSNSNPIVDEMINSTNNKSLDNR